MLATFGSTCACNAQHNDEPRFSEVDEDKTGTITLDELLAYFTKVGIHDEVLEFLQNE